MIGLLNIGILFIVIGIIFIITSIIANLGNNNVEVGVGGFIGPIPFGFFTSKKMFWIWLGLVILGLILWFLSRRVL